MSRSNSSRTQSIAVLLFLLPCAQAFGQPLGTFRWQQQPYCNVITVNVEQDGGIYHLDGTDDQCGAARRASAVGVAFPNPDTTIGFGLTIVTNNAGGVGGTPVHLDATINLSSLSGTWRDSAGQTGAWVFTPGAGAPGAPRPTPNPSLPPVFVSGLSAGGSAVTNVGAPVNPTDAANKSYVDVNRGRIASTTAGGFPALSDAQTIATVSITIASATQFVYLSGQAAIFTNGTLAGSCTNVSVCNIGIEIFDVDTGVRLTPLNGSFFRARTDFAGESLAVAIVVQAAPGTHTYRLQTEFNAATPGAFLLNNASLTAMSVPTGGTGLAPTVQVADPPAAGKNPAVNRVPNP